MNIDEARYRLAGKLEGLPADWTAVDVPIECLRVVLDAVDAVLKRHSRRADGSCAECPPSDYGWPEPWPCPTVRDIGVTGDGS